MNWKDCKCSCLSCYDKFEIDIVFMQYFRWKYAFTVNERIATLEISVFTVMISVSCSLYLREVIGIYLKQRARYKPAAYLSSSIVHVHGFNWTVKA